MRYFPMILAAGLLSAGLLAGSGSAHAMPALALDRSAVADTQVEKVAYYHRYARRHYRRGYGYSYGYRPYYGYGYRHYGYGYRRGYGWRY